MKKVIVLLSLVLCAATATAETSALRQAIDGAHRSAENKARDAYRHPEQTLSFFDVGESMTVVEIWPGAGWYTEILAPYLKNNGKLYAAHFSKDAKVPYFQMTLQAFVEKMKQQPEVYGKVELTVLQPPESVEIAPEGFADRVLTFRNVHNWIKAGQADAVFAAMFKALKPGGILGVVEHRSLPGAAIEIQVQSGYVDESHVIELAEKAGFTLLDRSEINANLKDSRDHPAGVWTLPPTLRLNEKDRAKYLAIGESDRMTLKFVKP
ncbi:class I SAM-dependent methyltransferase [Methylotuvimicrobium buryatense]|uniref:Methyltransferase n=1 Tax=Methylotuvimicrobium buryatense TaxID=95641 RepID=A0A4P9UII5_METBY|nr:class I SAM-dependent methyltransferase [Methylotuvimicrobium buryatense]QCW80952.1 methyltransferase [Methylotuvimicrobium buryatense]